MVKGGFTQELIRELILHPKGGPAGAPSLRELKLERRGEVKPLRPPRLCSHCGSELKAELRTRTLEGRRVLAYVLCPCCRWENPVAIVSF